MDHLVTDGQLLLFQTTAHVVISLHKRQTLSRQPVNATTFFMTRWPVGVLIIAVHKSSEVGYKFM